MAEMKSQPETVPNKPDSTKKMGEFMPKVLMETVDDKDVVKEGLEDVVNQPKSSQLMEKADEEE